MAITSFTDWRGNEVNVGDYVIYAVGCGSRSVQMREGQIAKINTKVRGETEEISSVGILAGAYSRYGSKDKHLTTVTVIRNITKLMEEPPQKSLMPTPVSFLDWEEHLKGYHGAGKRVSALRRKTKVKTTRYNYRPEADPSEEDGRAYAALLKAEHERLHTEGIEPLIAHEHDPQIYQHDWIWTIVNQREHTRKVWDVTLPAEKNPHYELQLQGWQRQTAGYNRYGNYYREKPSEYRGPDSWHSRGKGDALIYKSDGTVWGAYRDESYIQDYYGYQCGICASNRSSKATEQACTGEKQDNE